MNEGLYERKYLLLSNLEMKSLALAFVDDSVYILYFLYLNKLLRFDYDILSAKNIEVKHEILFREFNS